MFARTERLLLRPGWPEDAETIFQAISDEKIVRNLSTAPWPYSLEDAVAFLKAERAPRHPNFMIFLRNGSSSNLIGGCGFGPSEEGDLEMGYWIARDHWGKGYATEAARAVLHAAKALGHRQILASHFVDNPASGFVLRKLGFQPTGRTITRYSQGRRADADTIEYRRLLDDEADCDVMRPLAA